jgi:predicted naringenin-chalcone synthase
MLSQEQALQIAQRLCRPTAEQDRWLRRIYEHAGVRTRHITLGQDVVQDLIRGTRSSASAFLPNGDPESRGPTTGQRMAHYAAGAGPLAVQAGRRALDQAGLAAADITHLVTVSCTGFRAPGVDVELIGGLGLHPGTERTHIGYMGCHGALNGLRVGRALVDADPAARVLLCAVELCSLHFLYHWDPEMVIGYALFADGAAALVGGSAGRALPDAWKVSASGSCVFPNCADVMTWSVGDNGFVMKLSRRVPGLIATNLRPWLTAWLGRHELSLAEVGSWAVHPGGPKILEAVEESLELPRSALDASRAILAEKGNMSSPTVLFILDRLRRQRAARPCVALGFGPGLTVEAALLI